MPFPSICSMLSTQILVRTCRSAHRFMANRARSLEQHLPRVTSQRLDQRSRTSHRRHSLRQCRSKMVHDYWTNLCGHRLHHECARSKCQYLSRWCSVYRSSCKHTGLVPASRARDCTEQVPGLRTGQRSVHDHACHRIRSYHWQIYGRAMGDQYGMEVR